MVSYHNGDLLESGCDIICHKVNLQGVMGGGLALQIATKYPHTENAYKKYCKKKTKDLGDCFITYEKDFLIANCFSQEIDFTTNYEAVYWCFVKVKTYCQDIYKKYGEPVKIGVPFNYGCGIGNGDWNKVEQIFKNLFNNEENLDFQIWKL